MEHGRLTWAGHSTVRLEVGGRVLLTDPVLSRRVAHLRRLVPAPPGLLDGLDGVLISHVHRDHLDLPTLRRIDPAVPVLAPRGAGRMLRAAGRREVVELRPGDAAEVAGVRVLATRAEHDGGSRRGPRLVGTGRTVALGFVIDGGVRIYHAGDTDLFPGMSDLGPLDAALIPVGGWGPTLGPGHMDAARAAQALAMLRPLIAVPVHWGTYAPVGVPRRASYLRAAGADLARAAADLVPDVEVRVLASGETLELRAPGSASSSRRTPRP